MTTFRRVIKDETGEFAINFALLLPILLLCCGVAIDMANLLQVKTKLQSVSDAAVLSAAHEASKGNNNWKQYAEDVLSTNSVNIGIQENPRVELNKTNDRVQLTVDALFDPLLLQIFGYNELGMQVYSEANIVEDKKLEVAILLDISNSMLIGTDKFSYAQTAVNNLLDEFNQTNLSSATGTKIWVSLVPFGENVALVNRVAGTNQNVRNLNWFEYFETHTSNPLFPLPTDDSLCAELRQNYSYHDDTPPTNGKFTVWYTKMIPPAGARPCTEYTIKPLTDNFSSLKAEVSSIIPIENGTRLDLAFLWGWRSLSSRWRGLWWTSDSALPHDYYSPEVEKIIIMLSDGENFDTHDFITGKNTILPVTLDNRALSICDDIKRKDIKIYYVDYMNPRGLTGTLQACATSPSHYFNVGNGAALVDAFRKISNEAVGIRITK